MLDAFWQLMLKAALAFRNGAGGEMLVHHEGYLALYARAHRTHAQPHADTYISGRPRAGTRCTYARARARSCECARAYAHARVRMSA